jgi:predicted patatin/cPLA2 family phospholipase
LGELLKDHRARPGAARFGMVVQGGGMRGVYSMGALAALEDAGFRTAFDVVVGSSAGAINAAKFVAGQANEAVTIYVDHLSTRKFINPLRVWRIVDVDYMVDDVLKRSFPLNHDALRSSPTLLELVLTDAETALPVTVTNRDPLDDMYEALRATAALPSLYNRRVRLGDRLYVDGGVADSLPLDRALIQRVTHLVALVTRGRGFRARAHGPLFRGLMRMATVGQSRAVRDAVGRADTRFNAAIEALENPHERMAGVATWCVWPSDVGNLVALASSDKARLRDCAEMGRMDMEAVLGELPHRFR